MREILIAKRTKTGVDVDLFDVHHVRVVGNEAFCKVEDGRWFGVDISCVAAAGLHDLHGLCARMKVSADAHPPADGLWALSRDGKWVEARRQ